MGLHQLKTWTPSFHDSARDLHSSSPRLQSREPKNKLTLKLESHACSRIFLNSMRSVYWDDWSVLTTFHLLCLIWAICFRNSSKHLFSEVNKRSCTSSQLHTTTETHILSSRKKKATFYPHWQNIVCFLSCKYLFLTFLVCVRINPACVTLGVQHVKHKELQKRQGDS